MTNEHYFLQLWHNLRHFLLIGFFRWNWQLIFKRARILQQQPAGRGIKQHENYCSTPGISSPCFTIANLEIFKRGPTPVFPSGSLYNQVLGIAPWICICFINLSPIYLTNMVRFDQRSIHDLTHSEGGQPLNHWQMMHKRPLELNFFSYNNVNITSIRVFSHQVLCTQE